MFLYNTQPLWLWDLCERDGEKIVGARYCALLQGKDVYKQLVRCPYGLRMTMTTCRRPEKIQAMQNPSL